MLNHCQKLWEKLGEVKMAENLAGDGLSYAQASGDLQVARQNLDNLSAILIEMEQVWQKTIRILPDGREIWAPDLEAINRLIEDNQDQLFRMIDLKSLLQFVRIDQNSKRIIACDTRGAMIGDASGLVELHGLKEFSIGFPPEKLDFLAALSQLESLDIASVSVKDWQPLKHLVHLKKLHIQHGGKGVDLAVLRSMSDLEELNLFGAKIKNLPELGNLQNLKKLNLGIAKTPFLERDYSFLAKLTNLEWLSLYDLKVGDLSVLLKLPNLKEVNLNGIKSAQKSPGSNIVEELRRRGVKVIGV